MSSMIQSFVVAWPRQQVWDAFKDAEAMVACLPGASLAGPPDTDGAVKGQLNVKLGPVAAKFGGQGTILYDDIAYIGTLEGQGADRASGTRAKGSGRFELAEEAEASTRVTVTVEYQLAGALAQFARGSLVDDIARRMTAAFASNLEARLTPLAPPPADVPEPVDALPLTPEPAPLRDPANPPEPPQPMPAPAPLPKPPPAPQAEVKLDLLPLLWGAFKDWLARLFGRR